MRHWLLAFGIVHTFLALCALAADQLVLNAPANIYACTSVTFTWSGGVSPYTLSYRVGAGSSGDETNIGPLVLIGQTEETQLTFNAPNYPTRAVKFILVDQQNSLQYAWITLQASSICGGTSSSRPTSTHGSSTTRSSSTQGSSSTRSSSTQNSSSTRSSSTQSSSSSASSSRSDSTLGPTGAPTSSSSGSIPGPSSNSGTQSPISQSGSQSSSVPGQTDTSQSPGQSHGGTTTNTRGQSTAVPFRSQDGASESSTRAPISSQARNAIIGTIFGALALISGLFCWHWRRRRAESRRRRTVVPVMQDSSSWRNDEEGIMSERPLALPPGGRGLSSARGVDQMPGTGRKIAPEISEEDLKAMMALHAGSFDSAPSRPRGQSRAAGPRLLAPDNQPSTSHGPNIIVDDLTRPIRPMTGILPATPTTLDPPTTPLGNEHDSSWHVQSLLPTSAKYRREFGRNAYLNQDAPVMQATASSTVYSDINTGSAPTVQHSDRFETVHGPTTYGARSEEQIFYPDDTSLEGDMSQPQSPAYATHQEHYHVSLQGLITREIEHLIQDNEYPGGSKHTLKSPLPQPSTSMPTRSNSVTLPQTAVAGSPSRPLGRLRVINTPGIGSSRGGISDSEEESLAGLVASRINRGHTSHPSPVNGNSTGSPSVGHYRNDSTGAPPPSYG